MFVLLVLVESWFEVVIFNCFVVMFVKLFDEWFLVNKFVKLGLWLINISCDELIVGLVYYGLLNYWLLLFKDWWMIIIGFGD